MKRIALVSLALVLCIGCATVQVSTDHDPDYDFSGKTSYAWLDQRSGVQGDRQDVSSLIDRRIRASVEEELATKGLSQRNRAGAALLVTYRLSIEEKFDVDTYTTGVGYGPGWYGRVGNTQTVVREYDQGTLLIDLVDASSNQLVWRGTGEARLSEYRSPEEREVRIRKAVAEILASFPPGS